MARTVDPVAHAVRRDAFLDAAQRLMLRNGYAQLSIQDVIDEVPASKGAFYHYFSSKADLLEGVASRMVDAATASMAPTLADPDRTALEKLDAVFSGLVTFKGERKELVLAFMQVWLLDDNAIVREKVRRGAITQMTPLLAPVIRQGVAEGSFATADPDSTARVFVALLMGANEAATDLFVARQAGTVAIEEVERLLAAFAEAYERILGASPGSLGFANRSDVIREWFGPSTPAAQGGSA